MEVKLTKDIASLVDLMDHGDALVVRVREFRCGCAARTKCRHKPGVKMLILDDLTVDGLVRRAINRALDKESLPKGRAHKPKVRARKRASR